MDAPSDVIEYIGLLVKRLHEALDARLWAVYASGSLALGGYQPGRSDIDLIAIVDGTLSTVTRRRLAKRCINRALPCPARKLELVLIDAEQARLPGPRPTWQLNLNTGAGISDHVGLDPAAEPSHWFVLDLALAREHAVAVVGPSPRELIGALQRSVIAKAQADAIAWYAEHEPGAESVAAASRAWYWSETGRFAAKPKALRWALERLSDQTEAGTLLGNADRDATKHAWYLRQSQER